MNQIQTALLIKNKRVIAQQNDTKELQDKRQKFFNFITQLDLIIPEVFEMYQTEEDVIKSKKIIPQYFSKSIFANTRTKTLSETRAEIDKVPFEKAIDIICEICSALIRKKIHFCVFYSKGQRSPHIIIYDILGLDKPTAFKRQSAKAKFWRRVIPFAFHLLDHAIWADEHYVPLEFAPHWKYGTPFNLLFEYNPFPPKTYEEMIKEKKANAKKIKEAKNE